MVVRGEAGSRAIDVMTAIRSKIGGRALLPGERLPSIRGFAASMGVSPSTVVEGAFICLQRGARECSRRLTQAFAPSVFERRERNARPPLRPARNARRKGTCHHAPTFSTAFSYQMKPLTRAASGRRRTRRA